MQICNQGPLSITSMLVSEYFLCVVLQSLYNLEICCV